MWRRSDSILVLRKLIYFLMQYKDRFFDDVVIVFVFFFLNKSRLITENSIYFHRNFRGFYKSETS